MITVPLTFDAADTGLVIGDMTIVARTHADAAMNQTGATMAEMTGIPGSYSLVLPNETSAGHVYVYKTGFQSSVWWRGDASPAFALTAEDVASIAADVAAALILEGVASPFSAGDVEQVRHKLQIDGTRTAPTEDGISTDPLADLSCIKSLATLHGIKFRGVKGWDFTQAGAVTMTYSGALKAGQEIILDTVSWSDSLRRFAWDNVDDLCKISGVAQTYTQIATTTKTGDLLALDFNLNGQTLAAGVLTVTVNHSTSGAGLSFGINLFEMTVACCCIVGTDGSVIVYNDRGGVLNTPTAVAGGGSVGTIALINVSTEQE